ncbi:hypothetical protein [Rhodococcus baikonurensis]
MTKNSARKKAARAYQAAHPGTSFPDALRAVTETATSTQTAPPAHAGKRPPSTTGIDPQTKVAATDALTAIARSTRSDGSQVDFADTLADILAVVAANMGSVEGLLRGRPTSWEADLIHQLITGAEAEDELPARRTEPVRVPLDIDEEWDRFGLTDLAQEAFDEINGRMLKVDDESPESDALAGEQLAVDELEDSDRAAYISAFTASAREIAQEHGITAPIEVITSSYLDNQPAHEPDDLEERIRYAATGRTPHPITDSTATELMEQGITGTELAAALRAAGRDYRARAARASS